MGGCRRGLYSTLYMPDIEGEQFGAEQAVLVPILRGSLDHYMTGRISAAASYDDHGVQRGPRPMASFCRCGLAFYGQDITEADGRLYDHVGTVTG